VRIVISEFMSLDGVVQAPGGVDEDRDGGFAHGGWSHPFFDPEVMGGFIGEEMAQTDALLFGRRTWQSMAAAWPERAGDEFADQMNAISKYVVTSTLSDAALTWNNTMAAVVLSVAPVVLAFFFAQAQFIAGISAGAVKE